ncbi:THO complex subunit 4 [Entomortierella parvispora]|uniref:THO complex subunit 4 n=1 Tax=Entomortierella parvispora TaxID=205924 RepID=A0A9P3M107_9FUNG|nr:THO complex subunit 4 [Entomortierella parvispora]
MAARFLDMALDDVAKSRASNNRSPAGGRGGRGGRGGGRDSPSNRPNRNSPYSRSTSTPDDRWTHDKFEGNSNNNSQRGSGARYQSQNQGQSQQQPQSNEGNAKIIVENLHYAVTLEDIKELFDSHAGPVKLAEVKYDLSGRSTGVATILFKSAADAATAIRKLHGIALDGQPMKISYAPLPPKARVQEKRGSNSRDTGSKRDVFSRLGSSEADIASRLGRLNPVPKIGGSAAPSGGDRRHSNQSSNINKNRPAQAKRQAKEKPHIKTTEELDAEMDTYMGEATA